MTTKSKIILSMMAAAAAGAAVGVLFAPAKGSDLRRQIKDKANDLADDLCGLLDIGQKHAREAYAGTREFMVDRVEKEQE